MPPQDLLNTLGKNPKTPVRHGQAVATPSAIPATAIADLPGSEQNDLLAAAASAEPSSSTSTAAATVSDATPTVASELTPASQVESATGKPLTSDWTEESLIAEMRKARDEAKRSRLEKTDAIERLKAEYEAKIDEIKAATKPLEERAKELADLRVKEADKKRSLEERLADRDARLVEKDAEMGRLQEKYEKQIFDLKAELESFRSEVNVQNQFYQEKLNEELNLIPDKFKVIANRIIKGCDSARESLEAIREAKDQGMFKEKQTVVSHSVPTLGDGARISSASVKQEQEQARKKMKSTEKIGSALKNINDNPIFKGKRI